VLNRDRFGVLWLDASTLHLCVISLACLWFAVRTACGFVAILLGSDDGYY